MAEIKDASDAHRWDVDFERDGEVHDECGVFGVYAPGRDVARLTFFGLYALQHRGQESAGIATSDGHAAHIHKSMGLVAQVFNEDNLRPLTGHLAIGHTRYSTTGSSHLRNAQPYLIESFYGPLGLAHNGNLTNALQLRRLLLERGVGLSSTTDSEVITQMLAAPPEVWENGHAEARARSGAARNGAQRPKLDGDGEPVDENVPDQRFIQAPHGLLQTSAPGVATHPMTRAKNNHIDMDRWEARISAFMQVAEGAYSLVILTRDAVYATRDPHGLRPLCVGKLEGGFVVASETCALQTIGAQFLREVNPGEIVRIDAGGLHSVTGRLADKRALCIFEYVYFARPDSVMEGQVIHQVRQRMGRQLAREAPADADIVVAVPDSSTPAAIGFSLESGLPFTEGLIKNRYIGRTFIQPDDLLRRVGVHLKYNPLTANLQGKRVVVIDDSIVRGNTAAPLVQLLRDGGAAEVHMRVSSPPVRHPCFMGVDMATYKELIAHRLDIEGIRKHISADSLDYLSLYGMVQAVQDAIHTETGHCTACFSGAYPIKIPPWLFSEDRDKMLFEATWA